MVSKSASFSATLLGELQDALRNGNVARRVETLRRVTDLFILSADNYSDDQIDIFDDVFHYLIKHIEASAKALLANRLAPIPKAPPQLMYTLAFDDLIEVAAPMLTQSERLTDDMLIASAQSKSQAHLLAISGRRSLSGAVTDVLIEHGNMSAVTVLAVLEQALIHGRRGRYLMLALGPGFSVGFAALEIPVDL